MKRIRIVLVGVLLLSSMGAARAQGFEMTAQSRDRGAPLREIARALPADAVDTPSAALALRLVTPSMRAGSVPPGIVRVPRARPRPDPEARAGVGAVRAAVNTGPLLVDIEGVPAAGRAPSDANGAVGASQYVQWVNTRFAVYRKTDGALLLGPLPGNALFADFGGSPGADACRLNNNGDPIALYDKLANRWVMSQFAWLAENRATGPYYQCVAVSTSADATGSYHRYVFETRTAANAIAFNDYGKLGVWDDAYYLTSVLFQTTAGGYLGPQVCGLDRAAMLSGAPAVARCHDLGTFFGPVLPADLDGTRAPPPGSPNFLLSLDFNADGTGDTLYFWRYSFTRNTLSAARAIAVAPFTIGCPDTYGGPCVRQPPPGEMLDALGDRLMYRLAYRNFGTRETLLVNHSVQQPGAVPNGPLGVRWYELREPNGAVYVYQQGTFAPDADSRWMGSLAMDMKGNIALGYSVSGPSTFPGVRYTGRLRSEPLGRMEPETSIVEGGGVQIDTAQRWGDYSAMAVDPFNDCDLWYTQQYIAETGRFNWHTRIASFKFRNCY